MENIINAILGLQKQKEKNRHHKQSESDGSNEVRHSLICFHDFTDWFKL